MRRRQYLRSSVLALGLGGFTATHVEGADASPSTDASSSADTPPATDASPSTASPPSRGQSLSGDSPAATPGHGAAALQSIEPLAHVPISNETGSYQATEAVVAPDGEHAFVSKVTGFHAVDVSDPENPEIVATVDGILVDEGGPLENILDLKYNRGRLLVAAEGGSTYAGIALFDVRDPTDPTLLRHYRTGYGIHNCFLYGDHAYLTTGSILEIVDVGRRDPARVSSWSLIDHDDDWEIVGSGVRNLHDMYVQDDRAYLAYWDAGTWIVDVSDPATPSYLGHVSDYTIEELATGGGDQIQPPGNDHYVQPNDDGTVMAVGKESWSGITDGNAADEVGPSGIDLWDVADPSDPSRLATIDPPPVPDGESASYTSGYWTTAHNLDIAGEYLYSSWYRGGVKVHDISDPANPEEIAHWEDGETASFWTAQVGVPGDFFVGSSLQDPGDPDEPGGLYVFPDPTDNDATVTPAGPEVDVTTPAPTPTPSATPNPTPSPTETPTATRNPTATASPTRTPTETASSVDGTASPTTTSDDGPGFGVLAALGALGTLGAGALGARRDDDGAE